MRVHSLILATALTVAALMTPTSAQETGPYPEVDPATDMIDGVVDAPVTMTVYVSPACIHCINLMNEITSDTLFHFIRSGDLRIVVRQVPTGMPPAPAGTTDEVIANAHQLSNLLSLSSKCVHQQNAVYVLNNWKLMHLYARGGAAGDDSGVANWPYLDRRQLQAFFRWFWTQDRDKSLQELASCIDDPARRRPLFAAIKQAEDEFVDVAPAGWNLPVIVVDGQIIDWTGVYRTERWQAVEDVLEAAVENVQ